MRRSMYAFVHLTDSSRTSRHVRKVPIVLKKSFLTGDGNFSEPLMRFVRRDVRDHIGSHKNDRGPSYPRQRPLQPWRRRKIILREILGAIRFSTFASANRGSHSELRPHIVEREINLSTDLSWRFGKLIGHPHLFPKTGDFA